jgi:hypothetical protein
MLRIPHCLDSWFTGGGKAVSLKLLLRSTPQKHYFFAVVLISVREHNNFQILLLHFRAKKVVIAIFVLSDSIQINGVRGSVVVKALCYKPEGRGFDTR